jgi:hypothetical protein
MFSVFLATYSEDGWLPSTEPFTTASANAEAVVVSRLLGIT